MMQYFLKLEEIKGGSGGYVLSGAIFVPGPNLGLLNLRAHLGCFYNAVVTCKQLCEVCSLL